MVSQGRIELNAVDFSIMVKEFLRGFFRSNIHDDDCTVIRARCKEVRIVITPANILQLK